MFVCVETAKNGNQNVVSCYVSGCGIVRNETRLRLNEFVFRQSEGETFDDVHVVLAMVESLHSIP